MSLWLFGVVVTATPARVIIVIITYYHNVSIRSKPLPTYNARPPLRTDGVVGGLIPADTQLPVGGRGVQEGEIGVKVLAPVP